MPIQRTSYQVGVHHHKKEDKSAVEMHVFVNGKVEDRGDILLMIIDAWAHAMTEAGFDPDKSFMTFRNHGRLQ